MNVRPYGTDAVLVETGDVAPAAARQRLAGERGIGDVVPGARTLLVEYDPAQWTVTALVARLSAPEQDGPRTTARHVEIPTRYDGPDLDAVAALCGLPVAEVVGRHQRATYTVAFCGFSPGFAYLTGLDAALQVPRLSEPRRAVPAGAVAIAGEFAAIYPRTSPGGWRLLGTTDVSLWDLTAEPPALLQPGTTVRFVAA